MISGAGVGEALGEGEEFGIGVALAFGEVVEAGDGIALGVGVEMSRGITVVSVSTVCDSEGKDETVAESLRGIVGADISGEDVISSAITGATIDKTRPAKAKARNRPINFCGVWACASRSTIRRRGKRGRLDHLLSSTFQAYRADNEPDLAQVDLEIEYQPNKVIN